MASWRKQGEIHHQVGHRRKPPLDKWQLTVPSWEKKFCTTVGLVPWPKLIEAKKYMNLHDNVLKWDDSAGREAFYNAKNRFWAQINGLPCNISLPDPNIYIDDVDWSSSVDPELILDLESEAKVLSEEERGEKVVILGDSLLWNHSFSPTGWGDAEEDIPKPADPIPATQGWESNLHENNGIDTWERYCTPDQPAIDYEWQNWQNDSWGWNQGKHSDGDWHKMGRGRGYGNWGKWDGYNRRRDNVSWNNKTPAYQYHDDEYQMNRGRRNNNGGRRRGNFACDRPYVKNIPAA